MKCYNKDYDCCWKEEDEKCSFDGLCNLQEDNGKGAKDETKDNPKRI